MCLVSLDDPGLEVFGYHRLISGFDTEPSKAETLANAIREHFDLEEIETDAIDPAGTDGAGVFGYIDSHFHQAFRLRMKDPAALDQVLPDRSPAYRSLDAVVLEELILKRGLGMTDESIAAKQGIAYAQSTDQALAALDDHGAAFILRPTPVEQVRAVAAAGETMPPKSTYFFPKVPTGIVFNPLS
jgi:uncharacterized protein (DUF1015 family)